MLKERNNLLDESVIQKSSEIFLNIKSTKILNFSKFLAYSDFKKEVRTDKIIQFLFENGREVYLPKCDTLSGTFIPVIYGEKFSVNKYGIREPENIQTENPEIDCAIVPGVAFDIKGNRIGFGAGYYDKFFKSNPGIYKIGICYEFQLCDEIPADSFDIPMDIIITEKRIISIK